MKDHQEYSRTRTAKAGWIILLVVSALLILAGQFWYRSLPQMAVENIAEYANLEPGDLMQGEPSSVDIISLIARGYGAGYAALGLMAVLVALEGYRNGTRWAWMTMWVLVLAYAAIAGIFLLAGETYALSLGLLGIAVIALVGLLLARKDLSLPAGEMDSSRG
jgi:hypothetical protein